MDTFTVCYIELGQVFTTDLQVKCDPKRIGAPLWGRMNKILNNSFASARKYFGDSFVPKPGTQFQLRRSRGISRDPNAHAALNWVR